MEIIIDGMTDVLFVEGEETVGHVLEMADEFAADHGRAVARAKLDGVQIRPGPAADYAGEDASKYSRLELTTTGLSHYAADTLLEARKHLVTMGGFLEEIADELRTGRLESAMSKFTRVVDGWPVINEAMITASAVLGVDAGSIEVDGEQARGEFVRIGNLLTEANDALERGDYVLLADVLQYELVPSVERQVKLLQNIAEAVRERRAAMH